MENNATTIRKNGSLRLSHKMKGGRKNIFSDNTVEGERWKLLV